MSNVHDVARNGFGAGTNELYDRARPSYQAPVLSYLRQIVRADPPITIVEIGAGTGIFTRALLAHPEWSSSVKEIKAVEPSSGMREVFCASVQDERVSIADGTFESTGIEDGWADIIIIAQAFHWCPDFDRGSAEFARILKPNGIVTFVWNLEDRNGAQWVAQLRDRIERHEQGSPQFRLGLWRQTFDTDSYKKFFEPQEEKVWSYKLPVTLGIALDRASSKSYIAVLSEDEHAQVKTDVKTILERGEGMVWMDESKGIFEYPYQTLVVVARKK